MYKWNPVFNLVMDIKKDYVTKFGDAIIDFKHWLEKLNVDKYNDFFECLQVNQYNEFILIRYGIAEMQKSMWTDQDSPYRECRSVVIDLKRENLVTCGFRKFFNLNEVEENMLDVVTNKIKTATVFEVADKLDGSMQNARWYEGAVFMTGSIALDENESWRLANGKLLVTEQYEAMLKDYPNLTFTFEYVSDKNPHVVEYKSEQEGLYLIGARDVVTGYQLSYVKLKEIVAEYPTVKIVETENKSLEELLELMETEPANQKEGWVINVDNHLIKIKCNDYVNIHRILDRVASVNVVIEAIADGYYDDLLSKVPHNYRDRVEVISDKVFNYTNTVNHLVTKYYNQAPKEDKKEFMVWVNNNVPKQIHAFVRNKYLGKTNNFLKVGKEGYKRMNDLGLEWIA